MGRRSLEADRAFRAGDIAGLRRALGNPPEFPNGQMAWALGLGEHVLEYALYWSPVAFVANLLSLGADPNYPSTDGFPALIAAILPGRPETPAIVEHLLDHGADICGRGINDWTALHAAVAARDLPTIGLLLDRGADPLARTAIDDRTSALDDAIALGFSDAVALMHAVVR